MIQYSLRIAQRFAILIPGIVIAIFSVRDIFPYFDSRLPLALAVLATYSLGAYVLIPGVIRVVRIVRPTSHLPLYCVTPDGFASDPLNIGIIGTRRELINSMEAAGWQMADPKGIRQLTRQVYSVFFRRPYPSAPVSNLYLFGRKQDLAFEIQPEGNLGTRHHVRFWATTYSETSTFSVRSIRWRDRQEYVFNQNLLWVGAASYDVGITFIRHNLQISHMIDPNTDRERELIVNTLQAAKQTTSIKKIKLHDAYRLMNRVWRGYLQTDGMMTVVSVKH